VLIARIDELNKSVQKLSGKTAAAPKAASTPAAVPAKRSAPRKKAASTTAGA